MGEIRLNGDEPGVTTLLHRDSCQRWDLCHPGRSSRAAGLGHSLPISASQPGEAKVWGFLTRETVSPPVYLASPSFHFPLRLSTSSKKRTCCAASASACFCALGCLVTANCSASYLYHSIYSLLFLPEKSLAGPRGSEACTKRRPRAY